MQRIRAGRGGLIRIVEERENSSARVAKECEGKNSARVLKGREGDNSTRETKGREGTI